MLGYLSLVEFRGGEVDYCFCFRVDNEMRVHFACVVLGRRQWGDLECLSHVPLGEEAVGRCR